MEMFTSGTQGKGGFHGWRETRHDSMRKCDYVLS